MRNVKGNYEQQFRLWADSSQIPPSGPFVKQFRPSILRRSGLIFRSHAIYSSPLRPLIWTPSFANAGWETSWNENSHGGIKHSSSISALVSLTLLHCPLQENLGHVELTIDLNRDSVVDLHSAPGNSWPKPQSGQHREVFLIVAPSHKVRVRCEDFLVPRLPLDGHDLIDHQMLWPHP